MSALTWYLLGVMTPIGLVVMMAVVGCVERLFDREDRP